MDCKEVVITKIGCTAVTMLSSYLIHKDKPNAGMKIAKDTTEYIKEIKLIESIVECAICHNQECECDVDKE